MMRFEAAWLFDSGQPCGAEANMAKLLAADTSWEAANVTLQTYGGLRECASVVGGSALNESVYNGAGVVQAACNLQGD